MKNIQIVESGETKQFYGVNKLIVPLVDGVDTSVWIPEDEAAQYSSLGIKNILVNGVYNAADDNLDGYSQVVITVPTGPYDGGSSGSGGVGGEAIFMDSLETNVLNYIAIPNLTLENDVPVWVNTETHTYSCANTSEIRGLWVIEGINLEFKEQHLVLADDYSALTVRTHLTALTINGRQLYFRDIIGGTNPYNDYTFYKPTDLDPTADVGLDEMHKVYIRRTEFTYSKVKFDISEISGTYEIRLLLGTGTGAATGEGKGIVQKTADGMSISYKSREDTKERGIFIDDSDIYLQIGNAKYPMIYGGYVDELPANPIENFIYFTPQNS